MLEGWQSALEISCPWALWGQGCCCPGMARPTGATGGTSESSPEGPEKQEWKRRGGRKGKSAVSFTQPSRGHCVTRSPPRCQGAQEPPCSSLFRVWVLLPRPPPCQETECPPPQRIRKQERGSYSPRGCIGVSSNLDSNKTPCPGSGSPPTLFLSAKPLQGGLNNLELSSPGWRRPGRESSPRGA